MDFINIIAGIIVPIFIVIAAGVVMDRIFHLDINTLSKLNFYILVPAIVFISIADTKLALLQMGWVATFGAVLFICDFGVAQMWRLFPGTRDKASMMTLCSCFYNCGNYGLPFTILAFGKEYVGVTASLMVCQNLLCFTVGLGMVQGRASSIKEFIGRFFRVPLVWAVIVAYIFRGLDIPVPAAIHKSMQIMAEAVVAMALFTLGVQLARTKLKNNLLPVSGIALGRLVISPLIAFFLLRFFFHFSDTTSLVLTAIAGMPVAVNVFIISSEYNKEGSELASQSVFATTCLSIATLAMILLIGR